MEYIYAALLLHKAGKEITEDNVKKVMEAAGINVDEAKVKALVAALEGVNIDEAMNQSVAIAASTAPAPTGESTSQPQQEEKKEEKKEDKKSEEEAAAGLGALFG